MYSYNGRIEPDRDCWRIIVDHASFLYVSSITIWTALIARLQLPGLQLQRKSRNMQGILITSAAYLALPPFLLVRYWRSRPSLAWRINLHLRRTNPRRIRGPTRCRRDLFRRRSSSRSRPIHIPSSRQDKRPRFPNQRVLIHELLAIPRKQVERFRQRPRILHI